MRDHGIKVYDMPRTGNDDIMSPIRIKRERASLW